jgi:hypothetical protein
MPLEGDNGITRHEISTVNRRAQARSETGQDRTWTGEKVRIDI